MSLEHIRCEVLTWDWREQTDLDRLARALTTVSGGSVHLRQVDTGSDQYAIVLSSSALSEHEAQAAYHEDLHFDDLLSLSDDEADQ